MSLHRNNAFVLILLIAIMAALTVAIFVLSSVTNRIAFEADSAYLRACSDNLIASGLVWAEHNKKELSLNDTVILDVNSLAIKNSQLSVARQADREISLSVSCSKNRLNLTNEITRRY